MRRAIQAVVLSGLASLPIGSLCAEETGASGAALPADVAAYADRRAGCNHWGGEDAYDKDRGRDIAAALNELGCVRIDADELRLRQRYSTSPRILKALDQARDRDG